MINLLIPPECDAVKAEPEMISEVQELSSRLARSFIKESWECLTEEDYDLAREKWEIVRKRWETFISEGERAN